MSEADAEDGLHGLDETTSGMNEGTTLDLHFIPTASCSFQEARPAFLPPIPNSNPPREKNKDGEVAKGEGGTPRVRKRTHGAFARLIENFCEHSETKSPMSGQFL